MHTTQPVSILVRTNVFYRGAQSVLFVLSLFHSLPSRLLNRTRYFRSLPLVRCKACATIVARERKPKLVSDTRDESESRGERVRVGSVHHLCVWNFATDSRGKDKAYASEPFIRNGEDNGTRTATRTVASDGDACSRFMSRTVHVASKASFASAWKDEMIEHSSDASSCCDSDFESSFNVEHRNERASSLDRVTRRNRFNANASVPNPAPRFKWSIVKKKKAQKYHWSGTFNDRVKKYRSLGDKTNDDAKSDPIYNYNLDAFDEQKSTKKTKLSHYNDLNVDEESSESNGRRDEPDTSQRSAWKARPSEERRNSIIKREKNRRSSTVVEVIPKASSYFLKRCSPIDKSASYRLCNLLLSLVRNLILFSFLPTLYVAFFVYVQRTSQHR